MSDELQALLYENRLLRVQMGLPPRGDLAAEHALERLGAWAEGYHRAAREREIAARRWFVAGFMASGEGWNGEVPLNYQTLEGDPDHIGKLEEQFQAAWKGEQDG